MVHTSTLKRILILPTLIGLLLMAQPVSAQADGEKLFTENCASCHALDAKVVGPALRGVHDRPGRSEKWLLSWVKNSAKMIADGDALAVKLYEENNKSAMNNFENLGDDNIKAVLAYIKDAPVAIAATPSGGGETTSTTSAAPAGGGNNFYSTSTLFVLSILVVVLLTIVLLLSKVKVMLGAVLKEKFPDDEAVAKPSWYKTKFQPWLKELNPTIATLVVFGAVAVLGGGFYFKYANTEIGVQKGYAPTQPIAFDHSLHAGEYKIDCQYCHSTASFSKQASVPAVNTCMNCHSFIDAKDKYEGEVSPEIQKIRDAYKSNTPIKWVRIHNLPDHAYFNHSQHVGVGKVECQTCHGPIEEMKKVAQHTNLQMGWCINCHREAKVDVANNDYYEKIHEELKGMGRKEYTVAMNGGLECAKCHY
jgi:cytochrome c2